MLNRSAVVIRPRQLFVDWLRSVKELELPTITLAQLEQNLYMVPEYQDPREAEKSLELTCGEIFRRELQGWYTDEEAWPKDRSLKVFKQWFDVDHFCVVEDVGRGPIRDDENGDDE